MAETFDDLYSNLRGNPEFSELFSTPGDFETFLKEEPNADQHIKELFDVDNASGYLKKKDQEDVSTSNSLLGGINAYEPKKVVEPTPVAGQPKTQVVSRTQPELILSKQVDGVINTISTEANNPYKALNQLVELNKTLKNPSYKALVSGGKLGNEWVALNQKIGELYKSTPMLFDNPQTKQLLTEMGLQDPSAKAFGQQPQYKPGTFTAPAVLAATPAKTAADYAAERNQAQLQRTGDISQRGISKETLATQQEQQKTASAATIAKQTEQLTPTVQFNQATGQMEEKVSESQDWGSALKGIENELNSYDELRVKQNEGAYSTQDEQDFTERRRAQVENDFVAKLQPQIDKITADISDNFESEKEVMGVGIFFKRDRDGFLAVDPAYLNAKVDNYIDNQKLGDDLYLPNTEQGNQYKKDLKQAIKAQLTGRYNAILTNKIAVGRIGEFDISKVEAKAAKEAVDYVSQYDGILSSEVKTYTNTLFDPVLKYEKEEGARINSEIEQLNALVENKAIDEQTYFATRTSLQEQVEDLSTQSMNMRIDATTKANTFLAQKKKSRIKDLENFESQVQEKYKGLTQKEYEDYKKKYVGAITSYKNEQQDANAASWQIVGGLIMPDLDILDDLQSSLATIASSAIQLSGIQDYNINFVDSTINNLSKIAVGNQYMGRSLSNSRSFIEGLGAVTQQLIDQVPTIGTAAAMGIITRNPYLTSAFMMYTDLAREAQNVQSDIINGGGTAAEAQTAKGKVIDQHLLMTPLYFGQGSLLTGAASKAGSTSFAANYFKGLAMEYPLELTQEVWQEYTGQKFSGALKKEDGTNKSFGEWLSTDGANLAVDLLPTIALLGGAQAVSETSLNRKIIGDYQAVNKFLGDKNLAQFVSDTYNVMGENMVNLIPEHLRATGQITDSEFQDLKKKFKNYVGQLADVDKIGITNLDDSRYYMYQLNEIERAKADLASATNPSTKNAIQKKIDGLQNNVDNLIQGKEVNYVKFTFSNGASFVMSEEDAAKNLKDLNPLTNMMGAEITNKNGEKVPMLTMETSNAKLNKAQQEIFKRQEKRKEATGVTGANLGEQAGGASVNNKTKLKGIIASSKLDEETARLRTEEAQLAQSYLDQEMPGVKIVFFNDKDYQAFMPKVKGNKNSNGNFAVKYNEDTKKYEVEIHINLEKANSKTIGHEVTHAVLLKTFGEDIGKFTEFRKNISKLVSDTDNEALNNFARKYNLDVQAEEYLSELAGLITSEGANIEKGTILKMMTYISDLISKLTGGRVQPFKNVQDMNEAIDFFNGLSDNLSRAKNKDAVQEQTAGQVPVQSEASVGEEMGQGKPQTESQVTPQEGQEEVKSKSQVGQVENLPVYFGGAPDILNNLRPGSVIYVSQNKAEAQRYADQVLAGDKANVVNELAITGNIATEEEAMAIMDDLDLNPQAEGYSRGELMLMELLDPNMGESALSASDIKKFNDALKAKGFDAVEFVDNGLQNKEEKNIYVANTDVLSGPTTTQTEVESPLTPAEQEIQQEEIADFVENADEFSAGIAVRVNPNQTFNSVKSKSQIGVYEEAVLNGKSFSNSLPTKTLKEIAKQYDGRLFIITSDGTGYGIDSEGNPIFGGFGFLTHPQNQKDGVGFASVDTSTVKSTVTSIRKFYGNSKVAVLVMIQPPYTTINNSYGSHYFIRSMKQLASNSKQLLEAKNSFKDWVTSNKDAMRNLKKEDSKSGKRNTLSALFNLIDSIDANTDVNAFTKEFLKDTTFDSRKAILQGLMPDKEGLQINKNTPIIKKLLLENGFNTESFLAEYGDKTFLSDDVIKSDVGGFVVGGFEINIKPEEEMLREIEALQSKGFVHPLFNGKLPGSNHFALDGLYGVNENFAKFNLPQTIIDYKAVADKFQNENLIPSKKPNKNAIEGAVYADDKINQLVQDKFKNEGDYKEEAVDKLKGNYPPNQTINFETEILPKLRYTDLKGAKKIEFKKTIAQPMGILKNQVADVSTDIAKGIGFQPSAEGKEAMKTAEFVKGFGSKSQKVASKGINTAEDFQNANEVFGTEDGQFNFLSKSQLNPKEVSNLSTEISTKIPEQKLEGLKKLINNDVTVPTDTKTVYKLFKVKKGYPGELFPLFVGANQSVTTGEWIQAKAGELTQTKEGKTMVKSTLGPLAYRPGWHSGDIPIATHIGSKINKNDKAPSLRSPNQVWAEVEVGNDVDWQTIANERAEIGKNGKPIAKTAHITDQLPLGGSYKYKTNSNMTGSWVISGEMKVNKVLTQAEVDQINKENKAKDLPRTEPFNYETYGFNTDGSVQNPKQVVSNQISRAYLDAKEKGTNPELVSAVDAALSGNQPLEGFGSKSQIDNLNIGPEYQTAIASGKTNVEAYGDLIKTAYTLKSIKDQLGSSFDQNAYDTAISNDALETMNKFQEGMRDKIEDVKGVLQLNYISLNDTSALSDIRADLREQGYTDLPIFTAFIEMDFATPEQLQEVFGAEYRKTIQDAINRKSDFSSDFLNDLSEDEQNIKIENKAADLTNAFVENGLTFLDASVGIEYLLKYLNDAGLLSMASTLRDSLKDMKNDPKEVQKFFQTFSQLSSMAGRILNMARFIFEKQLVDMIADSLSKNGIVLTTAQTKALENLANDFKQANAKVQENKKLLEEDWSDEAFNKYWASEKELGLANVRLMQFLDARKPNFWNDRLTSGGARGLLNFGTTVLSFTSNVENNLYSTNPINRGIQKLTDKAFGGIGGTTLSNKNWKLARELTKKQSSFEMSQARKYGNMQDVNTLNRYYDGLGQINFFRDAQWSAKFAGHFIKMVTGKEPLTMTDEEFVDAFDQTLIRMKDGDVKLRDGRTYTIAKSFFWTMSIGPQASELTGRLMAYGGDIMFGQMAAQRAVIDYLQNTKDSRFEKGLFENQFQNSNGELSKEAIRAMSLMIFSDPELKNKFEQEGLKRTLLADNFISKGFGFARGGLRKEIARLYGEISKEKYGLFTAKNAKKQLLQAGDVLLWTLMPFSKVPANFLGSALMKVIPGAAMAKSVISGVQYNTAKNKFEAKHPIGKKYITEREKKNYEKDKIDLFAKKRQATYDVAQIATATAIQTFALSAVKSGALLLGDDEEKNKNLKGMNLRGGLYNASLHAEYLMAKAQNLTNYFTGGKDINTEVFLAKRGGYAKEGDNILNINNLGFVGYGMGLWGAIWEGGKNKEQASILSFANYSPNAFMTTIDYAIGNGVENLPMFQGIARIGAILKDVQKDTSQGTSNTLSNFLGGTFSTSLAVFFPSFGSFMSKGNAELIQSPTEIFPNKETNWPAIWGKAVITTVQKLNRNVAFTDKLKNPYYESMVGPFGEDLSYRVTLAEPGTMGAYFQAMFDPFAIRNYSIPVKEADKDKRLHKMSAEVHAGFMDLTMIYQQLTGRNFVFSSEGASASVYEMISNPMKNSFQYDGTNVTLMGPDSSRNPKVFTYNLPNDLYRKELKLRGELRAKAFENWNQTIKDAKAKVSTLVDQDKIEEAEIILEDKINSFQTLSSKAQQEYMAEYKNNRMRDYFIIMKQRGLVSESMMAQMKNVGLADADGLISK